MHTKTVHPDDEKIRSPQCKIIVEKICPIRPDDKRHGHNHNGILKRGTTEIQGTT